MLSCGMGPRVCTGAIGSRGGTKNLVRMCSRPESIVVKNRAAFNASMRFAPEIIPSWCRRYSVRGSRRTEIVLAGRSLVSVRTTRRWVTPAGGDSNPVTGSWLDLASFVATSSGSKTPFDELGDAIGRDCYIDVAGWHLFLKDVRVIDGDVQLSTLLGSIIGKEMMSGRGYDERDIEEILSKVPVRLGQGKMTVPLNTMLPPMCQADLLDICKEWARENV